MKITLNHPTVKTWTEGVKVIDSYESKYGEFLVFGKVINPKGNELFGVLRFFTIGGEVEVSQDIPYKNATKALHEMFRKYFYA